MRQRGNKASNKKGKSDYYLRQRMMKVALNKKIVAEQNSPVEVYCKAFGCGKQLSATEALYSDYCFKHQRIENEKASQSQKHLFRQGNKDS